VVLTLMLPVLILLLASVTPIGLATQTLGVPPRSGCLFQLDSTYIISSQSIKQSIVALSSTEVEYIAITTTVKELIWLQSIISKLEYTLQLPNILLSDNQSCIDLSENPKHHNRSKHIDLYFHFLQEKVQSQLLQLMFVSIATMPANILTKLLPKLKHYACLQSFNSPASFAL